MVTVSSNAKCSPVGWCVLGDSVMDDDLFGMATRKDVLRWIGQHNAVPLFLCVTGSHMWGLNRPDSDLDIRGIYVKPTEQVLAINPGKDTIEGLNELSRNVDFQLYELHKALKMLLNNNGNIVEMLLSPTCFFIDDTKWLILGRKFLTRKLAPYYKGYFDSQRKRAMANRGSKALVYTFRELLTGIWVMRTGNLIHDFYTLKEEFCNVYGQLPLLDEYMERHRWRESMSAGAIREFETKWKELEVLLDEAVTDSPLPESYDGYDELNQILLEYRLENMDVKVERYGCDPRTSIAALTHHE
jgi:uncharacterized protein